MDELGLLLNVRLRQVAPNSAFRAIPLDGPTLRDANPVTLFGPARAAVIVCEEIGGGEAQTASAASGDVARGSPLARFRLRGTAAALVSKAELKDVTPATLSFDRDEVAGRSVLGVVAVAGLAITPRDGVFSLAPYLGREPINADRSGLA